MSVCVSVYECVCDCHSKMSVSYSKMNVSYELYMSVCVSVYECARQCV